MAFDKKYYKEIKKYTLYNLNHRPWCCTVKCPAEWAKTFLPLITHCVHAEDYEGAKAITDAIREFLNRFIKESPLTENDKLILPNFKEISINGILCYVDPKNPLSGSAEIL